MTTIFEIPIDSETLTPDELKAITGGARKNDQIAWLKSKGWVFYENRAGEPIVGRLFARLKLAGITPANVATGGWSPDFTGINNRAA